MFGEKKRLRDENERLLTENERLHQEIARLAMSPEYAAVKNIQEQIDSIVSSAGPMSQIPLEVSRAIIRHSTNNHSALRGAIVSSRAAEQLEELLRLFDESDAATLNEEVNQLVADILGRGGIKSIAYSREIVGAGASLDMVEESAQKYSGPSKDRAKEMRSEMKHRRTLPLNWFQPGDEVSLVFTGQGDGYSDRYRDRYGSREYDSSLERRKIILELDDVYTGRAKVVSDSWLGSDYYRSEAICGGQTVYVSAVDPSTDSSHLVLVKNAPVGITDEGMGDLNGGQGRDLALWWVGLEQYLVMP